MITSADSLKKGARIDADLCIIGTGAAGISLGLQFLSSSLRVVLLEGGGEKETPDNQELYNIETTDLPIERESRVRAFGGTTTRWTGGWKPHDAIDFTHRPWVPFSGWPIGREDLDPYYKKALLVHSGPAYEAFEPRIIWDAYPAAGMLESAALTTTTVPVLKKDYWNFAHRFRQQLEKSSLLTAYLSAHVIGIRCDGGTVQYIDAVNSSGAPFQVRAARVVLAAGGIENARLLLASNIGNEHDQVGRYYMDHPKGTLGEVLLRAPSVWRGLYWNVPEKFGLIHVGTRFTDAEQKKREVLNSYVRFEPIYEKGILSKLGQNFSFFPERIKRVAVRNFLEQAPHPENRIRLSDKKDRFGSPLARIDWSLSELDVKTIRALHETLKDELAKNNLGEFRSKLLEDSSYMPRFRDASHHMGATRMGSDPYTSVVDENCCVHGIRNLYIAGSSVFPTGGYANPTATIIALALRLADYLKI